MKKSELLNIIREEITDFKNTVNEKTYHMDGEWVVWVAPTSSTRDKEVVKVVKNARAATRLYNSIGKQIFGGRPGKYSDYHTAGMQLRSEFEKLNGPIKEAKSDYKIYHNTYTSAVEEILNHIKKNGYEYSTDDVFDTISSGPKKPSDGKTNRFSLDLYKNEKLQRKKLHAQVYGMGKTYELNMYIS